MPLLSPPPEENHAVQSTGYLQPLWREWLRKVWQAITDLSVWIAVPQSEVTFSSESGTVSCPANGYLLYKYLQQGTKMRLAFNFQSLTLNGCGVEIRFTIPKGKLATAVSASQNYTGLVFISGADNGPDIGFCATGFNTTAGVIRVFRLPYDPGTNKNIVSAWNNSAAVTGIRGEIEFEVNP